RSPLAKACTTVRSGCGGGISTRVSTRASIAWPVTAATSAEHSNPSPSAKSSFSPTVSRRTLAAWRPSGPSSKTTSPIVAARSFSASAKKSGAVTRASAAVERVADAREQALTAGLEDALGELLAAQGCELVQQFFLLGVELGRRLHFEMYVQVAATVAAK